MEDASVGLKDEDAQKNLEVCPASNELVGELVRELVETCTASNDLVGEGPILENGNSGKIT